MENNHTDRQPRTVDFSLFDQIEKAVPAYDLDKAIQKRDYRIDLTQHYADAEYLLTVDGIGMLAKGNIQAVKGKAKQGKTFFITALVAAVLNGKFGALKASGEDYRVLIVDTEQNMKNVARNARKIHRLCGWPENENHPRFSAVALRGYNTDERREILEGEIALLKPDLVIQDGIKDLCRNIMDNPESTDVLDLLSRLSQDYNTAICCVLHENKSSADSNMRGSGDGTHQQMHRRVPSDQKGQCDHHRADGEPGCATLRQIGIYDRRGRNALGNCYCNENTQKFDPKNNRQDRLLAAVFH